MKKKNTKTLKILIFFIPFILMFSCIVPVLAFERTIGFDWYPGHALLREMIPSNTSISDAYEEYGLTLSCAGWYPDGFITLSDVRFADADYNAYAYQDSHAISDLTYLNTRNVVGCRAPWYNPPFYYPHWCEFAKNRVVVEFHNPVNMVRIYGAGDPFQMVYYNQDGVMRGSHDPVAGLYTAPGDSYLEISPDHNLIHGDLITKIEFGSYLGDTQTYFDDLTFDMIEYIDFAWNNKVRAFDLETSEGGNGFKPGTNLKFKVKVTVYGCPDKLYKVKLLNGMIIFPYYPEGFEYRVVNLTHPGTGKNYDLEKDIMSGENSVLELTGELPTLFAIPGQQFEFKARVLLFDMGDSAVLDEEIVTRTFNIE